MVKSDSGVPLLNFEERSRVPFSNIEKGGRGPRVPLLNLRGVRGPTFKL